MRLCPASEPTGVLPDSMTRCFRQTGPGRRCGHGALHTYEGMRGRGKLWHTFFMRGMGLPDHHCRMASGWCTGSCAKGCMGERTGSSIPGGATAAMPGPVLRRRNSLQASSMGSPRSRHAFGEAWRPACMSRPTISSRHGRAHVLGRPDIPWATACVPLSAGHSLHCAEAAVSVAQEACQ